MAEPLRRFSVPTNSMNLQLLNPFAHENFPERVDSSIDANAQCVRFNSGSSRFAGSYLAIGRTDGRVAIFDVATRAYLRFLEGHVKAVITLCWSRNSRFLLSASRDGMVIIWDLATGSRLSTVRFDAPILSASLHPRNSKIFVVVLQNTPCATLIDLRKEFGGRYDLEIGEQVGNLGSKTDTQGQSAKKRKENATVARFSPRGDLVFVGSSQGWLYVFDTQTKQLVHKEEVSRSSSIKSFEFDKAGLSLIINSNDRIIRVYSVEEVALYANALPGLITKGATAPQYLTPMHRFQDLINRTPWNTLRFSNDGEYIIGGAGHKAAHQIYLWDHGSGSLSKILEGPKDPLEDLDWHPVMPLCVSVSSDQGLVHIWATNIAERWSAYAPGFEELEENLEYLEREDEFDVEDESEAEKRKLYQESFIDIAESDSPLDIPLPPSHASNHELREYLASSDAWADFEADGDDRQDFAVPVDVDLSDLDMENTDLAQIDEGENGR